jgi:hypothetical protein
MTKRTGPAFALVLAATPLLFIGCGDSGGKNGTGGSDGGSGLGSAINHDGGGGLGFKPSNIDLTGMDLSKLGDVIITDACGVDTEQPSFGCVGVDRYASKITTFPDQSRMAVFVFKSLRVEQSAMIQIDRGNIPVALVALDTMTFLGSIKVDPGRAGGAYSVQGDSTGIGPGGGLSGPVSRQAAGGGGSFCGLGGVGSAQQGATPYGKSSAYGTPELVPLVGGSTGGTGYYGGGDAGGALQLVAGRSIELFAGAFISAPGQGGGFRTPAGGGGSGGAILIEAPTVTIAGILAVNGGGGGGADSGGDDGYDYATPAAGGVEASTTNHGGNGGAGDIIDGGDGISAATANAAGGGGVGRIRINTTSGQAVLTGATLSPSAKTTCFSQGKIKP